MAEGTYSAEATIAFEQLRRGVSKHMTKASRLRRSTSRALGPHDLREIDKKARQELLRAAKLLIAFARPEDRDDAT